MTSKKTSKKAESNKSGLSIKLKISKDKTQSKNKMVITVYLLDGEEIVSSDSDFILL